VSRPGPAWVAIASSTCGYLGRSPVAPGTVGSAAGLALWWVLRQQGSPAVEVAIIVGLALLGVWGAGEAERHFGTLDPGPVVIDEVVGMLVTLAFVPVSLWGACVGFFVFRLFDIVKPFPANRAEQLPRGWGIMADDVVAGAYAQVALRLLLIVAPGLAA